jgi:hypothetical protein
MMGMNEAEVFTTKHMATWENNMQIDNCFYSLPVLGSKQFVHYYRIADYNILYKPKRKFFT